MMHNNNNNNNNNNNKLPRCKPRSMAMPDLDDDLLLLIASSLSLKDVVSFGGTSAKANAVCKLSVNDRVKTVVADCSRINDIVLLELMSFTRKLCLAKFGEFKAKLQDRVKRDLEDMKDLENAMNRETDLVKYDRWSQLHKMCHVAIKRVNETLEQADADICLVADSIIGENFVDCCKVVGSNYGIDIRIEESDSDSD